MRVAIDTSVLIAGEHAGSLAAWTEGREDTFYVPAHAAAEFLVGVLLVRDPQIGSQARRFYEDEIRPMVDSFDEACQPKREQAPALLQDASRLLRPPG